ncbi:MAG TPA: SDR family oxidoreductase [Candidatus Bathyarchaeia archaeon]|nr:SDR family oxidoreductase [Candidatus Bathyarchaeia archaeon]
MRIETESLQRMREGRTGRILVTGATGFLGSHIAVALLQAGYRVAVLARASKGLSAGERMRRLTRWFGLDDGTAAKIEIVEGDILDPDLAGHTLAGTGAPFDEIVHCASNTSFAERKRAEVEAANVGGLRSVLDLAVRGGCAVFHHISTAYAAGRRTGLCLEDWIESGPFTNVYEETKARGEIMARDACQSAGIRLNVYRPSIVYGDSATGRTLRFNALYYPIKAALSIRDIYFEDLKSGNGQKAAEVGIGLTPGGRLYVPIRIETRPGTGINLVPVDHCVRAFLALFEDSLDGGIYHIANPRMTPIEEIVDFGTRRFELAGIRTCRPEDFLSEPKNTLEVLYDSYLEIFKPYMQDARTFDMGRSGPILERHGLACPVFDEEVFDRAMDFAVAAGWGAKLFG